MFGDRVRRRHFLPTVLVRALQRVMHADLAGPLRASRWLPLSRLAAVYLVGVGFRPERAPAFARPPAGCRCLAR